MPKKSNLDLARDGLNYVKGKNIISPQSFYTGKLQNHPEAKKNYPHRNQVFSVNLAGKTENTTREFNDYNSQ